MRSFCLAAVVLITISISDIASGANTTLGKTYKIAAGLDADVALDRLGRLHIVYQRGKTVFYRRAALPDTGKEILIGTGSNPQIAVDSQQQPHIVFGAIYYVRWDGSAFTKPLKVAEYWRKPRIAVDGNDNVYMTATRREPRGVLMHVYRNGALVGGPVSVGQDNNGSIAVDSRGVAHLTWRKTSVYHNTYQLGGTPGTSRSLHSSSDFSSCAVDLRDNSLHVVNTVPYGKGINYRMRRANGEWTAAQTLAAAQTSGVKDGDNVSPRIAVDSEGNKYVVFSGQPPEPSQLPYFFAISGNGTKSSTYRINPEGGSTSGHKLKGPNVAAHPTRKGAYVVWNNGATVFARGIGVSGAVGATDAGDAPHRDASTPQRDAVAMNDRDLPTLHLAGRHDASRSNPAGWPPPLESGCACSNSGPHGGSLPLFLAAFVLLGLLKRRFGAKPANISE